MSKEITEKQKLARQNNAKNARDVRLKKKELDKYVIYDSDDDVSGSSDDDDYEEEKPVKKRKPAKSKRPSKKKIEAEDKARAIMAEIADLKNEFKKREVIHKKPEQEIKKPAEGISEVVNETPIKVNQQIKKSEIIRRGLINF